jgi:two-component system CheB/CheR fusion protein
VSPIRNASGRIVGASKIARDITERKESEARRDLLTRELHHRTKNLFSVVQAVVSRSFAGKRTVEEAQEAVLDRIHSLGQAHILLIDKEWEGTDILELARSELRPFGDRVVMSGPPMVLSPQAAQSFALALHELATNAAKYGALSVPDGRILIGWSVDSPNGSRQFTFRWQERDGPPVSPPQQTGFGSTVLEQVMAEYANSPPKIDFSPSGVGYEVKGPLDAIAAAPIGLHAAPVRHAKPNSSAPPPAA